MGTCIDFSPLWQCTCQLEVHLSVVKMKVKLLQRCCIWFSYARGDTLQNCTADLCLLFGAVVLTERSIRSWRRSFRNGTRHKDNISDKRKPGRPRSARTDESVTKVMSLVLDDRRITIDQLHHETDISVGTIYKILHKDLNMSRVAAKFVPKILKPEEKTRRIAICLEWISEVQADPTVIDRIITGDETWVWCYDLETKKQSSQWIQSGVDARPKKCLRGKSRQKAMLILFFDSQGVVHYEYARGTITSTS